MKIMEDILKKIIKEHGPITFEEFMNNSLYHPKYGYYTKGSCKIGRRGDFYTSPALSPLFGSMLGIQLNDIWLGMDKPEKFTVVEYGAGTGKMASDIINSLRNNYPAFYETVRYNIIEISQYMREEQKKEFQQRNIDLKKIRWLKKAGDANSFDGCVISNEFVDALPFHRVVKLDGKLMELYVNCKNGNFYEEAGELSTSELEKYFHEQDIILEEGQFAEVNLNALTWLKEIAGILKRGLAITIDYGHEARELYNVFRRKGTMRCFKEHKMSTCPYESPGLQDITASVNFTALMKKGVQLGLKTFGLVSQQEFLLNLGIMDFLKDKTPFLYDKEILKKALAVKQLIMPQAMGLSFKVLIQGKNIEPIKLKGLTKSSLIQSTMRGDGHGRKS